MMQTIDIDIRGQICPSCLLLTLKELNHHGAAVRAGQAEVVVMTDDRQATSTIPVTAERMGFRTEVVRMDDGYRIRIFGGSRA
jgi:TusA-related sulfurtransferase